MTDGTTPRYPLIDLANAMGVSVNQACKILAVSGSARNRYIDPGMTEQVADRMATKADLHPAQVWPSWWDDQALDVSVECADDRCEVSFVPGHHLQRYCSEECRRRARYRRQQATRRARNPEKEAERRAKWADESREYLRAYKRRWNEANRDKVAEHARTYRRRKSGEAA